MAQLSPMQRHSDQSPNTPPKAQTSPAQRHSNQNPITPRSQTSPIQRYQNPITPMSQTSPVQRYQNPITPTSQTSSVQRYQNPITPTSQTSPVKRYQNPITPTTSEASPIQRYSHQNPITPTSPIQRYPHSNIKTPNSQASPTFEQLLHGGSSSQSGNSDLSHSSPSVVKNVDIEEDLTPHNNNKKSVLSKWREKVKKLRQNLSAKKMDQYPYYCPYYENATPSWGVNLEDEDEEDEEDPEYLGAPMYESELAPESYKETARQHPRADPVVSEKRAVPKMVTKHKKPEEENDKNTPYSKTITETVSEKLAPAYAAVSDVTHTIASSIVNLKISSSSSPKDNQENPKDIPVSPSPMGLPSLHPKEQSLNQKQQQVLVSRNKSIKSPEESDKGISVKEYVMHKLEPGDDEKALSKVVCDALSPTKKPQGYNSNLTGGVVGKVREVVTSLLHNIEEPPQIVQTKKNNLNNDIPKMSANPNVTLHHSISAPSTNLSPRMVNSSSPIPVSTNPHQVTIVDEEENLGRVLQAN